jgi:hypothetical protein
MWEKWKMKRSRIRKKEERKKREINKEGMG